MVLFGAMTRYGTDSLSLRPAREREREEGRNRRRQKYRQGGNTNEEAAVKEDAKAAAM